MAQILKKQLILGDILVVAEVEFDTTKDVKTIKFSAKRGNVQTDVSTLTIYGKYYTQFMDVVKSWANVKQDLIKSKIEAAEAAAAAQ